MKKVMVNMMTAGKVRLKGSTLVEILVAVAICMIIFTMALNILLKADREDNATLKLNAQLAKEVFVDRLKKSNLELGVDTIPLKAVMVIQSVEESQQFRDVLEVTLQFRSKHNKPLLIEKLLIPKDAGNE
ncbi:hypothetical protein EYV94_27615 [Puteibacter caeruleilacunae]|nr:hypothetical protein EYV94_27615 [Puteibacter caeruleilacunae]